MLLPQKNSSNTEVHVMASILLSHLLTGMRFIVNPHIIQSSDLDINTLLLFEPWFFTHLMINNGFLCNQYFS